MPNFLPQRTRWYCYELMVRANTPEQRDGEVKYWINGKLVSDFPNLNIRSVSTLKMDEAHIGLEAMHSERVNKKWYEIRSRQRSRRPSLRRPRLPKLLFWQLCGQVPTPQFKRVLEAAPALV